MNLAPIVLFAYNRLKHLTLTIDALKANVLACNSHLYVYSDGYKSDMDREDVVAVRKYLQGISGFAKITIVERERNLGLAQSVISGVSEVIEKHGRVVVLEDDMVTSPYFLQYVNSALEFYEDEEKVISIHGYIYPLQAQLPETFFLKDTGCWGWATWKRGWSIFEEDGKKLFSELKKRNLVRKFDMDYSYPFTRMLKEQIEGKNDSWAIRWQASAFLSDKLTLFPGKSLVRNIGHDNSGTHCGECNCFEVELVCNPIKINRIPLQEHMFVLSELQNYFRQINKNPKDIILSKIKMLLQLVRK